MNYRDLTPEERAKERGPLDERRRCQRCLGPMEVNRITQRCLECEGEPWPSGAGRPELTEARLDQAQLAQRIDRDEIEARALFAARHGRAPTDARPRPAIVRARRPR